VPFNQLIPHPIYGNNEGFAVTRGTAVIPTVSAVQAGFPNVVESIGSNRTPTTMNLDLGVYYPIRVGEGKELRLTGDWFNVFNSQRAVTLDQTFTINSGASAKMRFLVAIAFFALVAVAFAATPSTPVWPSAFAASVVATDNRGNQRYFRWYYDSANLKERFDGMVPWNDQMYYAEQIRDFSKDLQYDVFYQQEYATCFSHPINGTVPHPNFAQFSYVGQALVQYDNVYHWGYYDKTSNFTFNYFDTQTTREPKRFDLADLNRGWEETWLFMGFDADPQDASLFTVPSVLLPLCNSVTNPPQKY
jgi:hypothetical protein